MRKYNVVSSVLRWHGFYCSKFPCVTDERVSLWSVCCCFLLLVDSTLSCPAIDFLSSFISIIHVWVLIRRLRSYFVFIVLFLGGRFSLHSKILSGYSSICNFVWLHLYALRVKLTLFAPNTQDFQKIHKAKSSSKLFFFGGGAFCPTTSTPALNLAGEHYQTRWEWLLGLMRKKEKKKKTTYK